METENKKIGYYLERTSRIVKLNFHQVFKNLDLSLTPEQWVILDMLNQTNGLSQTVIAEQSFKDAPSISRTLDTLSKKQYVERRNAKDDRRKFEIFLTAKGKKIVKKVEPEVEKLRDLTWEGLSDEDYQQFLQIMNQVFKNLE